MRNGLRGALALCAVGGVLLLWSLGRVWVSVPYEASLTLDHLTREATGRELARGAQASAYVAVAAVAALVALRGWWRVGVGALITGAGAAGAAALYPLTSGDEVQRRAFRLFADCEEGGCGLSGPQPSAEVSAWVWVALVGALLVVLAGLVVVRFGRGWPGLSSRYERQEEGPASSDGASPHEPVTDKAAWEALDRGDDPTA